MSDNTCSKPATQFSVYKDAVHRIESTSEGVNSRALRRLSHTT